MRARVDPHARYRELIAARLEKPLSRVELRQLNAHLKTCPSCQVVDGDYRAERGLLRSLPSPTPPRDLWARTSARLDREVARDYRDDKWRRRMSRGRRNAQPSTALLTAVAAIGVSAAIAMVQLAPAVAPATSLQIRPTPLAVPKQQLTYVGYGQSDVAVYRTELSQVCPASEIDCVQTEKFVRTPLELPADMRAGNISLSPSGNQLALVGHVLDGDVIAVVMMPSDAQGSDTNSQPGNQSGHKGGDHQKSSDPGSSPDPDFGSSSQGGGQAPTHQPGTNATPDPAVTAPSDPAGGGTSGDGQQSDVLASAAPGLAVVSILDNVESAGAAPDWSPNGTMLAFSAMPDDRSQGPDVYIWSPGDAQAQAITDDHASYFASWSGNRIVMSRLSGGQRPHTFVYDPKTLEERAVGGPQLWLPAVNRQRSQAIGWFGQLDTSTTTPAPRSGALYLMDWHSVDPFAAAAPAQTPVPTETPSATPKAAEPPQLTEPPQPTEPPATTEPSQSMEPARTDEPTPDESAAPHKSGAPKSPSASAPPDATPDLDNTDGSGGRGEQSATSTPDVDPTPTPSPIPTPIPTPTPTSTPAPTLTPAPTADDALDSLVPLEPDRDPRAAPVVDWQAHWSADGEVLGVW